MKKVYDGSWTWVWALVCGVAYSLSMPPFNADFHLIFSFFPLLSLIVLVPFFFFAVLPDKKKALLLSFLYGAAYSIGMYFWIGFVTAEGLWLLILLGVFLICIFFGTVFMAIAMVFRFVNKRFPRAVILLFPAFWVVVEWLRSLGDISFPWAFAGYSFIALPWMSQSASLWGVYGLSFIIITGNVIVWHALTSSEKNNALPLFDTATLGGFTFALVVLALWGMIRINTYKPPEKPFTFSCIQANIDQLHWGNKSLAQSFDIIEKLTYEAAVDSPDCIVMAESALLCYLERRIRHRRRVLSWADSIHIPLIFGALHWENSEEDSPYKYMVYNTAFFLPKGSDVFQKYFKMKLVPFSEALPFEGAFPILSRVNLGESDFKRGRTPVTFSIADSVSAEPFICYEIIYPSFVRNRVSDSTSVLVQITNDGWFGKTNGPWHHAEMARMRCIENGIPLVRCANSGISMAVDPLGRIIKKTSLYTREILTVTVSLNRIHTLYNRLGDWPVWMSLIIIIAALGYGAFTAGIRDSKTGS